MTDEEAKRREEQDARIREQQTINAERLRRELEDAANIAEGVRTPTKVPAVVRIQADREILVAHCPHCGAVGALDGPGKHLCRGCAAWLDYVREE